MYLLLLLALLCFLQSCSATAIHTGLPASTPNYTVSGVVFILAFVGTIGGIFGGIFLVKLIRRTDFSRLFAKTITHDGLLVTLEKYDTNNPEAQPEPSVVEVIPPITPRLQLLSRCVHTALLIALARTKGLTSPCAAYLVKIKGSFVRPPTDLEQGVKQRDSWIMGIFRQLFKRRELCAPVLESIAVFEGPRPDLRPPTMNRALKGIAFRHAHLGMAETVEISSEGRITLFDRFGRSIKPKEIQPVVGRKTSEEESISPVSERGVEESKEQDIEVEVVEVQVVPSIVVQSPSVETIAVEQKLEELPSEEVQQETQSTAAHDTVATPVAEDEVLGVLPSEEEHQEESNANSEVVLTAPLTVETPSTSTTPEPSSSAFSNITNVAARPSTPKSPRSRRNGMYIDDSENDELRASPRRNRTFVVYKESAPQCDAGFLMPPSKASTGKARRTPPRQVVYVPQAFPSPHKGASSPCTPPRRPRPAPVLSPLASPQAPGPRRHASPSRPLFPSSNFLTENSVSGAEDFKDAFVRSELVSRSLNTHRVPPATRSSRPSSGTWI